MRRCGTLRRFMVRRRSAGAETAGGRSVGRVPYLRNLQNTSTRTDARVSAGVSLLQCRVVNGRSVRYQHEHAQCFRYILRWNFLLHRCIDYHVKRMDLCSFDFNHTVKNGYEEQSSYLCTVELGCNALGLCDTSFITLYILQYQLIHHKARDFSALLSTTYVRAYTSDITTLQVIGSNTVLQELDCFEQSAVFSSLGMQAANLEGSYTNSRSGKWEQLL